MALRLIGSILLASTLGAAPAWSQPAQRAELQVPLGQIEAYCDDFRQAMAACVTGKGVAATETRPFTAEQTQARRACRQEVQDRFDLYTASFCPGPEVDMAAADYAAMCVALNQRTRPCLEKLGYQAVVGQPIAPESYAWLRYCREQAGADMTRAKYCGPPAYRNAP